MKRVMDDAVSWPIVNHTTKDQDLFNQVERSPAIALPALRYSRQHAGGGFHHFASGA